jgi:hypothetical protein
MGYGSTVGNARIAYVAQKTRTKGWLLFDLSFKQNIICDGMVRSYVILTTSPFNSTLDAFFLTVYRSVAVNLLPLTLLITQLSLLSSAKSSADQLSRGDLTCGRTDRGTSGKGPEGVLKNGKPVCLPEQSAVM